jgi:hypothetical protein
MDEIISYKMCAVKVRNAKLRNYLKLLVLEMISSYFLARHFIVKSTSYWSGFFEDHIITIYHYSSSRPLLSLPTKVQIVLTNYPKYEPTEGAGEDKFD